MPGIFPLRPRRALRIDEEQVVESVLKRFEQISQDRDRGRWIEDRLNRYAKYRGWLPEKTWPWSHASNVHIPILQSAELRANAGLYNVLMTMRPLLTPRALSRGNVAKEDRVGALIDAQLWVDPGAEVAERQFADMCSIFLQDANWVALTPWVRDERTITELHYRPPVPEAGDPNLYVYRLLMGEDGSGDGGPPRPGILPPRSTAEPDTKPDDERQETVVPRWRLTTPQGPAMAWIWEDEDGGLEIVTRSAQVLHEGPVFQNLDVSQVFVPTRVQNLQPPTAANPGGSPYVFIAMDYLLDEVRRLQGRRDGFNWLDKDGLGEVEDLARVGAGMPPSMAKEEEKLQEQKDEMEGRTHTQPDVNVAGHEGDGNLRVPLLVCFDRWDVDGDGLSEDVLFIIARDARRLCEARLLTDKWPAKQPYRPLAEACAIPVPGRYYGISFLELGEALYDIIKSTFDIAYDSAQVANLPWFFYAASAQRQFDQQQVKLAPGEGYPVPGNPRETVWFPNIASRDQTWAWTVLGIVMQFFDRQMALGPLQSGQVPQGKATALRTFGTTAALLQQADVRADQLLIRLFGGIRQLYRNFHRMNRKLLPPGKEIRLLGWEGAREQAYDSLSAEDVDADMDFDFRPDFLLSNQALLIRALESMLTITATPLAFQLGITDPHRFYQAAKDYVRALRLDPKKYLKAPEEQFGPALLWEEALDLILRDQMPSGVPLEGPDAHLRKAFEFINSEPFTGNPEKGIQPVIVPRQVNLLRAWLIQVSQHRNRQLAVTAATQFQQTAAQGGGPPEALPTEPEFQPQAELAPRQPVTAETA